MALTDENGGMVMPVQPMGGYGNYPMAYPMNYGGFGNGMFGGDGAWLILFLLAAMWGGFGGGWGGGFGGYEGGAFPWLLASNNNTNDIVNAGFAQQATNTAVQGVQSAVTSGFGDTALGIAGLGRQICETGGDIRQAVSSGFAQAEIAEQGRYSGLTQQLYNNEIANLNRSFAEQTANSQAINGVSKQLADCCCENRLATQGLQSVIQTENCADRNQASQNTQAIITAINQGNQGIMDKLCALELDGVKGQLAQSQRENVNLQNQLNMANMQASQNAQNALITQGFASEVDALYNRLSNCPVPSIPVYGRQPIFTCGNNNSGCGCGMA